MRLYQLEQFHNDVNGFAAFFAACLRRQTFSNLRHCWGGIVKVARIGRCPKLSTKVNLKLRLDDRRRLTLLAALPQSNCSPVCACVCHDAGPQPTYRVQISTWLLFSCWSITLLRISRANFAIIHAMWSDRHSLLVLEDAENFNNRSIVLHQVYEELAI